MAKKRKNVGDPRTRAGTGTESSPAQATAPTRARRRPTPPQFTARRTAGVLGTALALTLLGFLIFGDLGDPEIPDDAVAVVEGIKAGEISKKEFDRTLNQVVVSNGGGQLPPEDSPEREQVEDAALAVAIQQRWVRGEASDRGVEVTDEAIDAELESFKQETLGGNEQRFQQYLRENRITEQELRGRARLGLLVQGITNQVTGGTEGPDVPEDTIEYFYEENIQQFEQPANRDVRVLLNEKSAPLEEAAATLGEDDSDQTWQRLAKQVSSDQASKDNGGLLQGITEGQFGEQFDAEVFAAGEGEIIGPFETDRGFYVVQVEAVNEASTTPLEEVRPQIEAQIIPALQQTRQAEFQAEFAAKWSPRTFCVDQLAMELCASEIPSPFSLQPDLAPEDRVEPVVRSTSPMAPGAGAPEPLGVPGLPQRPKRVGDPCEEPVEPGQEGEAPMPDPCGPDDASAPAGGTAPPEGSVPLGPGGAPGGAPAP